MGGEAGGAPRSVELLAALSLATDLGTGQPLEHALRTSVLAVRLGALAGVPHRELADRFAGHAGELFAELDGGSAWEAALAAEPGRPGLLAGDALDEACAAVADFADLKSPFTLGHSAGVAELAEAAAWRLRLPPAEVATVRRAGLLHDLGRVGVSNRVWDKPGPLSDGEWEQGRLHPYQTQRAL